MMDFEETVTIPHPDTDEPDFDPRDYVISSCRVVKGPTHWRITLFNRSGNAGTITVNAHDGAMVISRLMPPRLATLPVKAINTDAMAVAWNQARLATGQDRFLPPGSAPGIVRFLTQYHLHLVEAEAEPTPPCPTCSHPHPRWRYEQKCSECFYGTPIPLPKSLLL